MEDFKLLTKMIRSRFYQYLHHVNYLEYRDRIIGIRDGKLSMTDLTKSPGNLGCGFTMYKRLNRGYDDTILLASYVTANPNSPNGKTVSKTFSNLASYLILLS